MSAPHTAAPEFTSRARRPGRTDVDGYLAENRRRLEDRLADECGSLGRQIGPLADVLAHAVGTEGRGGARWRPLLVLAAAAAQRGVRGDALDVAVAVELTHTASLVLDDLPCMDDAELRRGRPATHRLIGSAGAILLSVGLLSRAAELLGRQPRCGGALAEEWGRTVGLDGMAGGQAMDVAASGTLRGAKRRLHRAKSAALPAFALAAGARTAGAGDAGRAGLEAFGRGLGWAYQLLDDDEDRAEDARQGRASVGPRPVSQSARIMQRAYRRLFQVPGLTESGLEILIGLAGRVVPEPAGCWGSLEESREGRF